MLVFGGPPASSSLLYEDAEGTGTPSGWVDTGTVNWDYTTTVLAGSQSFSIASNASGGGWYSSKTFTPGATRYGRLIWRASAVNTTPVMIDIRGADGSTRCFYFMTSNVGAPQLRDPDTGLRASGSSGVFTSATTYYLWWRYTAGTGTNAVIDIHHGTSKIKSEATLLSTTAGEGTEQAGSIRLGTSNYTLVIFDAIEVSETELGDFP